ncbi:hypothetical protein MRB53_005078 [Persea americana]|uniref:Uncharacterized protein n=1 Tax=Persea americana TaxID=3435 RepID=A0ACC2MCB6_PERAE|nr:hypothetical protein MRB53_005078 [Persea americana]
MGFKINADLRQACWRNICAVITQVKRKMVANGGVPPRGSAAAAASLRRRRAGGGGATTGGVNTMLQFYTDSITGWFR